MGTVQYVGAQNPHSEEVTIAGYQQFIIDATPGEILTLPDAVCSYLVSVEANWWVVAGGWSPPPAGPQTGQIANVSSAYTVPTPPNQYVLANSSSASFPVTLPDATLNAGQPITVKNVGSANTVTVTAIAGQTLDGSATFALAAGQAMHILSDGSVTWRITNQPGSGGSGSPTGPAGGKLSGTYPNPGLNAASTDLSDSAALARLASPALTGAPTAPTAAALDASTKLATTAYSDAAVAVEKSRAQTAEALLAPVASPTFTGVTTAPEFTASGLTGATAASRYVGATASGAPTSGTFAVGDFVIDQTAAIWICTVAGSPGTWAVPAAGAAIASALGWIDMCSPPYNCVPGTDITTPLQTALNAVNAANLDATLYFSKTGVYHIYGASQTGTWNSEVTTVNGAGQTISTTLSTLIVGSTSGFPTSGTMAVAGVTGTVTYTGLTGTTFTGCTIASGSFTATNGGTVTGSGNKSYSYAGQILIPSRPASAGVITVTIKGSNHSQQWSTAQPGEVAQTGSLVLQTNATSGYIIDAIPASANNVLPTATFIKFGIEDITFRAPDNPQCGGINCTALEAFKTSGSVSMETMTPNGGTALPTGTLAALVFPPYNQSGPSRQEGDLIVQGWGIGIQHNEHFVADNIQIQDCGIGIQPNGNGHGSVWNKLLIQGTPIGIQPLGICAVKGFIDIGDLNNRQAMSLVLNDGSNWFYGDIDVVEWGAFHGSGFPVTGGLSCRFRPVGSTADLNWPSDQFQRLVGGANMGVTDQTHHVWTGPGTFVQSTGLTISGGSVGATGTGFRSGVVWYWPGRQNPSRSIRAVVTTGTGAYNPFIIAANTSPAVGNTRLQATLVGGVVQLQLVTNSSTTVLATSAASAVAASTTYYVDVVISNPTPAGPMGVSIYVGTTAINGTSVLSAVSAGAGTLTAGIYTLAASEFAQLNDQTYVTDTRDGIGFYYDQTSRFTQFRIGPA